MNHDLTNRFNYMTIALIVGYRALMNNETPVSCIFVSRSTNKILSIGYNDTNNSLNGTRHAEFVAMDYILNTYIPKEKLSDLEYIKSFYSDVTVYVTVEPCVMCASALRQVGIGEVVFGCGNDRFGGNGTVFSINRDKSIDDPYNSYGGVLRTEAVQLLRNFYIQENISAPQPKIKKNKDIDNKEYPLNLAYRKYLSEKDFIDFYGDKRIHFYEEACNKEITPIIGQGYTISNFINIPSLIQTPQLKHLYGCYDDADFEKMLKIDLTYFVKLFYDIDENSEICFDKEIITVENIANVQIEDTDHKKRRLK